MFPIDQDEISGTIISDTDAFSPYSPVGGEVSLKYLHGNWDKFEELGKTKLKRLSEVIHEVQKKPLDSLLAGHNYRYERIAYNDIPSRGRFLVNLYPEEARGNDCIKVRLTKREGRIYMVLDNESETKYYMLIIDPNHKIENTQS